LQTKLDRVDLTTKTNDQLVALQLHDNDWLVRHARRILHERTAEGGDMSDVQVALNAMLQKEAPAPKRLRALWALKVTAGLSDELLISLLSDQDESIRSWAVRLLCEDGDPPADGFARMMALAKAGQSQRVRLSLASALQRLKPAARWPLAEALATRSEDATDQNIPLMVWYGIEPLIGDDINRFAQLACEASIPRVRENIARRIASSQESVPGLELLFQRLASGRNSGSHADIVSGVLLGLQGQGHVAMPATWPTAYKKLRNELDPKSRQQAMQLALVFNDQQATDAMKEIAIDSKAEPEYRKLAIDALVASRATDFGRQLLTLLDDPSVRGEALRGLSNYGIEGVAPAIISRYASYEVAEKQIALQTLASRLGWAAKILDAVEKKLVPSSDITAFTARQLRSLGDEQINSRLNALWGNVRETPKDRVKQIDGLRKMLSAQILSQADLSHGKELFKKQCGNCHRFFGEGGAVGPDITGAQRNNLEYLLENIVDPSASVAKEFHMQMFRTTDGRVINGLVESEGEHSITIVNATEKVVVPVDEIEERKRSEVSVMPNGLLDPLSEREIRDLMGYLQR
jgi:putative heme-binding domain-containing protein